MTTPHTPGPWKIAPGNDAFVYALGPHHSNLFWAQVQSAGPDCISVGERYANARLIAAAPDMLAVLKEVYKHSMEPNTLPPDLDRHVEAVIAKAEGR